MHLNRGSWSPHRVKCPGNLVRCVSPPSTVNLEEPAHENEMTGSAHLQRLEGHKAEVTAAAGGALLGEVHISNLPQHGRRPICSLQAALHSSPSPAPPDI